MKLDRLGRSTQHLLQLVDELHHYNIDIAFSDQPIDTTNSMGRFTFQILSDFAEFERELIVERTKAGLERAIKKGKRIGRPKLIISNNVKKQVIDLHDEERSYKKISENCNISLIKVQKIISQGKLKYSLNKYYTNTDVDGRKRGASENSRQEEVCQEKETNCSTS